MKTHISEKGIELLKNMIGKTIVSITADDWRSYNRSYGNIKLEMEETSIEIENDYRDVLYFNSTEELAGYNVLSLEGRKFESYVLEDKLHSEKLDREIIGINLIRDIIFIYYENEDKEETHTIDQAIIFKFHDIDWLISQTSIFTPMSKMLFGKELTQEIKSIEDVKADWEDDDLAGGENLPKYKVRVKREVLEL